MTVRHSRTMRELLLTTADLLSYGLLQDADARLFVHKHRKTLREISRATLVKRADKSARRGPSELTKSWANHVSNHHFSFEASLRGNITTGPERTPLGVMTLEQAEAYKRQRLADVQGAAQEGIDDSDAGRFTSLDSAEALTAHLKSLARKVMESDE